jgi:hydrogenase/urease accessory protein HupE
MTRLLAALAAILISTVPAFAHPAPFSYLDVRLKPSSLDIAIVVHVLDIAHDLGVPESTLLEPSVLSAQTGAVHALLAGRLKVSADGRLLEGGTWSALEPVRDRDGIRTMVRFDLPSIAGRLSIDALLFPYDPAHQTFVNVHDGDDLTMQAILSRDRQQVEYFSGSRQGTLAVVRKFVASGMHHILIGPDHLLFLVGLLLLGGSIKRLALVVTAFTAAHSVTLSLAVLKLLTPPAWVVEPAIALSIVYVGADNLTVRGGRDVRAWIAFVFGLIHGFGFANVLGEMDLPQRALGWTLLSFNLGVELGQLAVVVVVASLLAAVRRRSEAAGHRLAYVGSLVVIAAGAFWFIERVFFAP